MICSSAVRSMTTWGRGREVEVEPDVGGQQASQHRLQLADERAGVDQRRRGRAAPRERQELARELGGPFGGGEDLIDIPFGGGQLGAGTQAAGIPRDDGEQIVEVVGDAAGELADGLHLLRLGETVGDLAPFGDVGDHAAQALGLPIGPAHDGDDVTHLAHRAVGGDDPVQQLEGLLLLGGLHHGERGQAIPGVHHRHPEAGLQPVRTRVAEQHLLATSEVAQRFPVGGGRLPHDRVQGADDLLYGVGLGIAQSLLLQLALLGGVAHDGDERPAAV